MAAHNPATYFNILAEPVADQPAQATPTAQATPAPVTQPVAAPDEVGPSQNECLYDPDKPIITNYEALVGPKDPYKGNPDAAVTVVEFFDPNCPHCKALHPVMKATIAKYGDRARFVYKPVSLWQYSIAQNVALWVAAEEGKFFEVLELQFEQQQRGGFRMPKIRELVAEVGMDADSLEQHMRNGEYDALINGGNKQAQEAGVSGGGVGFFDGCWAFCRTRPCVFFFFAIGDVVLRASVILQP